MYMEQTRAASMMQENNNNMENCTNCDFKNGMLPVGGCAPMAFPYVPMQNCTGKRYGNTEALQQGTLFPGLDLPFKWTGKTRGLSNSALNMLMAMDFSVDDLGLYLTTHSDDKEALELYWSYIRAAREAREKYERANGPLCQTDITEGSYEWLNDPWPWDEGGNR